MPCHGDTYSTVGREKFSLGPLCGGGATHFSKCLGRKFFWEKLKILGFAWGGELTLDDTMNCKSVVGG